MIKIGELTSLIKALKLQIRDDYIQEDDTLPSITLTVGYDPKSGNWSYQTGDNSYTGGAYGYPIWGVGSIYRRSKSREVAKAIREEILDQVYEWERRNEPL